MHNNIIVIIILLHITQVIPVSVATVLQQDPHMLFYELKEGEYNYTIIRTYITFFICSLSTKGKPTVLPLYMPVDGS